MLCGAGNLACSRLFRRLFRIGEALSRGKRRLKAGGWSFYILARSPGRFGGAGGFACHPALDHGQHSAERAKPAEIGLPSMYAVNRLVCSELRR